MTVMFLSALSSILLSRLSFGAIFFPIPVLLASYRIEDTRRAVGLQILTYAVIMGWELVPMFPYFNGETAAMLVMSLMFKLMACTVAALFTALRNYTRSMLRKLVICSVPVMAMGAAFVIWFTSGSGNASMDLMIKTYEAVIPADLLKISANDFARALVSVVTYGMVPLGMICGALPVFFAEMSANRFNAEWQEEFALMKMPGHFVWFFFGFWGLFAVSVLLKLPAAFSAVSFNLAMAMSMHYMLNGLSVLLALIRIKLPAFSAGTIIYFFFFASLIVGLDMVMWGVLTITGVLETWIRFR